MNRIVFLLAFLTVSGTDLVAQAPKLGHIDRVALINNLPGHDSAEVIMRGFVEKLQARLEAMKAEFDERYARYMKEKPTMTATAQEMEERELKEMNERLVTADARAEEDAAKQEQELLAPLIERVDSAIKAVATEKGFTYIFDLSTNVLVFYEKGEDITPLVKAKLGIK